MFRKRIICASVLTAFIIASCAARANAEESQIPHRITVTTKSGRKVTGRIDHRSTANSLVLLLTTPNIILRTSIDWGQIEAIQVAGSKIDKSEFAKSWQDWQLNKPASLQGVSNTTTTAKQPNEAHVRNVVRKVDQTRANQRIRSLAAIAFLQNWDADPEPDGIEVQLALLDQKNQPVAVPGQVRARLHGLPVTTTGGRPFQSRKPASVILEQWSHRVRQANEFDTGVLTLRLPFRRLIPGQMMEVANSTLLEVKYGIPGTGDFQASVADVLIREPSLFRDVLQQRTGRRRLAGE